MSGVKTRQIVLAQRPQGAFAPEHMQLREVELDTSGQGKLLAKVRWLSLDPMQRIFFNPASMGSAVAAMPLGSPIVGPAVAEVVSSNDPGFAPGDLIEARAPWQDLAVLDAAACRRLPRGDWSDQAGVGVLGMPGFSAWVGMEFLRDLPAGSTLLISGAAGVVGSVAGQLGLRRGLRVVGIASGAERCRYLTGTLGFTAAVDRSAGDLANQLKAAAPEGVIAYFDNVGGDLFLKVLPVMARRGVIIVCGLMAHYEGAQAKQPTGPDDRVATVLQAVMGRQLTIRPFSNRDYLDRFDAFLEEAAPLVASGDIQLPEVIHEGLESAPAAFARLLAGGDLGKHLVHVS